MTLKEQILALRVEGKTYDQIKAETGASKGTISYYCGEGQREKTKARQINLRSSYANKVARKVEAFNYEEYTSEQKHRTRNKNAVNKYLSVATVLSILEGSPSCYLCGQEIDYSDPANFSLDHIVSRFNGGTSTVDNFGVTHSYCNMMKGPLDLDTFVKVCYDVVQQHSK